MPPGIFTGRPAKAAPTTTGWSLSWWHRRRQVHDGRNGFFTNSALSQATGNWLGLIYCFAAVLYMEPLRWGAPRVKEQSFVWRPNLAVGPKRFSIPSPEARARILTPG